MPVTSPLQTAHFESLRQAGHEVNPLLGLIADTMYARDVGPIQQQGSNGTGLPNMVGGDMEEAIRLGGNEAIRGG